MKTNWTLSDYQNYTKTGAIPLEKPKVIPKHQKEKIINLSIPKEAIEINKQLYSLLKFKEEQNDVIFISGNVPSSKNNRNIVRFKKKNIDKTFTATVHSKAVKEYIKQSKEDWEDNINLYHTIISDRKLILPLYVGLYFIRKTAHRFDGNNASQIITDLMTLYKWHNDDDMDNMTALPLGYHKDKDNPGVYIFILDNKLKTDILNYI